MPNFSNFIKLSNLHMIVLIVIINFSIGKPQKRDDLITELKNDNKLMTSQNQVQWRPLRWTLRTPEQMNNDIKRYYENLQFEEILNEKNDEIYPENRTDQTLDTEICLTHQIQEKCHPCSQREFQLNVDECAKTYQIEKMSCHDRDNRETILIRSCTASYEVEGENKNAKNNKIYPENRTDQTLDSEICLTHQIQEECHTCSQREFQLNIEECAKTHQIEVISCLDKDYWGTILIRSCGEDGQMDGSYSFVDKVRELFSNLIDFFQQIFN